MRGLTKCRHAGCMGLPIRRSAGNSLRAWVLRGFAFTGFVGKKIRLKGRMEGVYREKDRYVVSFVVCLDGTAV